MVSNALATPPHGLELVIDFVNSLDTEEGSDDLATPQGLGGWLAKRRLLDAQEEAALGEAERREAVRLREALRALMLEHNGGERDEGAARELEEVARRGGLGVHFGAGGEARLAPAAVGLAGALAAILVPVAEAARDGTWQRVKACRADDCLWAFYDRSRNRSGVWCSMSVCGNRAKVRSYRSRGPGAAPASRAARTAAAEPR
jgi:predicted RNA-binding Zn ribbon-like protein